VAVRSDPARIFHQQLKSWLSVYSPAWDANLYEWTQDAINQGFRGQLREEFQILTFVQDKLFTGPGGKPFGSAGFSMEQPDCSAPYLVNARRTTDSFI
jgi:hypothetical protein